MIVDRGKPAPHFGGSHHQTKNMDQTNPGMVMDAQRAHDLECNRGDGRAAYYTPEYLYHTLLDDLTPRTDAETEWMTGGSVLEPSYGDGRFLEGVCKRWQYKPGQIHGADISKEAQMQTLVRLASLYGVSPQMFPNIVVRSGLVTEAKRLSGHTGKHRLIVGNPPYMRMTNFSDNNTLKENLLQTTAKALRSMIQEGGMIPPRADDNLGVDLSMNSAYHFVIQGLYQLHGGGRLAMVVPATLWTNNNCDWLRKYMQQCCTLVSVRSFLGHAIWKTVKSAITAFVLIKTPPPRNHEVHVVTQNRLDPCRALTADVQQRDQNLFLKILHGANPFCRALQESSARLDDVLEPWTGGGGGRSRGSRQPFRSAPYGHHTRKGRKDFAGEDTPLLVLTKHPMLTDGALNAEVTTEKKMRSMTHTLFHVMQPKTGLKHKAAWVVVYLVAACLNSRLLTYYRHSICDGLLEDRNAAATVVLAYPVPLVLLRPNLCDYWDAVEDDSLGKNQDTDSVVRRVVSASLFLHRAPGTWVDEIQYAKRVIDDCICSLYRVTTDPILTPLAREICGGQQMQQQEEPSEDSLLSSKDASEEGEVVTDNDSLFGGLQVFLD